MQHVNNNNYNIRKGKNDCEAERRAKHFKIFKKLHMNNTWQQHCRWDYNTYLNWFMSLCSLLRIMTLISANGFGAESKNKTNTIETLCVQFA